MGKGTVDKNLKSLGFRSISTGNKKFNFDSSIYFWKENYKLLVYNLLQLIFNDTKLH